MKSTKFIPVLVFTFLLVFTSCELDDTFRGDQQQTIPETFSQYFGNNISRDFLGNVIDKNKLPIEGVTITIGNKTTQTDSNGIFIISDANVNERFGYIKAEKMGYIHGSRSIVPSEGANKVTIMLLEATVAGTVSSGSEETVSLDNGSSVSFDGNFVKEDGSEYSGSVDVIMHHLDPSDEDMPMQMPGMLYAENEDGAERMLQTLGMLAVELRGSGGEDLNLAEGSTSEIKIPVDESLMSIAPATIPLWYFDEINGYWKEEGEATLQGNMYVGTVTHFSFWNCDIPVEAITLCVNVTDENGNLLNNMIVSINSVGFGTTYGITNDRGKVCGYVPSGETLVISVFINGSPCNVASVVNQNIGPFTEDSSISIGAVLAEQNIVSETVTGTFTCGDDVVTNGYAQLDTGNQSFVEYVTDGTFEMNLLRCENDDVFTLRVHDYFNTLSSSTINYTFTTPFTNLGVISPCSDNAELIQYTIDDEDTVIDFTNILTNFSPVNSINPLYPYLEISGFSENQQECFYIEGILNDPNYIGEYNYRSDSDVENSGFWMGQCLDISDTNNNITFNLSSLGAINEFVDINFSGTYEDSSGVEHTITGIIHVLRD